MILVSILTAECQRGLNQGSCGQGVTWRVISGLGSFIAVSARASI
jgi:hypothetical protein